MKRPLFSCVIPIKGERPYFDEVLESLQNQGLGDDLEIIVQDADFLTQRHEGSEAQRGMGSCRTLESGSIKTDLCFS